MTASIVPSPARSSERATHRPLPGLGPLFRKELGEWAHGKRAWVILAVTTLFMTLTAANGAITSWIVANAPAGSEPSAAGSLAPLDNLGAAVSSEIFVVVAIFAVMSLLVAERERGTLSWVASKPVSRGSIWVAKWLAASIVVSVVAGLLPMLATFGLVVVLYGPLPASVLLLASAGTIASIALMVAVVLTTSTVVSNQPAVAAIGFTVFFLPQLVLGLFPAEIAAVLPTSILPWAMGLALGAPVGFVTPLAFGITAIGLVAVATWRMGEMELEANRGRGTLTERARPSPSAGRPGVGR